METRQVKTLYEIGREPHPPPSSHLFFHIPSLVIRNRVAAVLLGQATLNTLISLPNRWLLTLLLKFL